jgi:hypothetical protein
MTGDGDVGDVVVVWCGKTLGTESHLLSPGGNLIDGWMH